MNRKSIRVRFLTTVATNVLRAGISFCAGLLIAQALGPAEYGNFNFLLGSFMSLATLVDMASSSAFYTFVSQKHRGTKFFIYYSAWFLIQFTTLLLLVLFLPASLRGKIWLGHPKDIVLIALFASFTMNQIWRYAGQIGESIRDTVGVQIRNIVLALAYLSCVLLILKFNLTSIKTFFILNTILYLVFACFYGLRLYKVGVFFQGEPENLKDILREFRNYCSPLAICAIAGFFYYFADYWLLQKFGGPVQQGYYAIGAKFATFSLIATTSILQVFWKEIAEAHSLGNAERVRQLYEKVSRGLYFFGAVLSCFLVPFTRQILGLLLGPAYQEAWIPLSLMFLYPVHQSLGQITGTMLYSMGHTRTKSYIGLFFMAISIPTTYFMLARKNSIIPGLGMGSLGLSLKMVLCQLVDVNLMALFVAKYLKIPFKWSYQAIVLLLLVPAGFISKFLAGVICSLSFGTRGPLIVMTTAALLYGLFAALLVFRVPSLAGSTRQQINLGLVWVRERLSFA
jgi:O-antigen/teichoic acid export membrane protein